MGRLRAPLKGSELGRKGVDKEHLEPALNSVSLAIGSVGKVLPDSGYYSAKAMANVEDNGAGPTVYAATNRHPHGRNIRQLEQHADPPAPPDDAPAGEIMVHCLTTEASKALYGLRKQTVEPAFGIIKEAMGFRRFLMSGLEKVNLKWTLVTTSYNLKHLFNLAQHANV